MVCMDRPSSISDSSQSPFNPLQPPVDRDVVAGGETGILACEERHRPGYVVGTDKPSHRRGRAELMHLLPRQLLGHPRSLHCCWCDEVGGDPVRRQFQCDEPDELVQRRLGGAQRDHPLTRTTRQPGTQIDQPTVAAGNHSRHNGLRHQECGTQLAVQLAAELLPGQLGERGDGIRY